MTKYLDRLEMVVQESSNNIVKVKIINIDNYEYQLDLLNGSSITKNIEIYGDIKLNINDYIYISESTLKEEIPMQYGPIINNKAEIIKIKNANNEYYLQKYYG